MIINRIPKRRHLLKDILLFCRNICFQILFSFISYQKK